MRKSLAPALAALSANVKNSGALELARELTRDLRDTKTDSSVATALAPSLAVLSGNIASRESDSIADTALQTVRGDKEVDCGSLAMASRASDLRVIIELLQWPQCASDKETADILRVAENRAVGGAPGSPHQFESLGLFIDWAESENQKGRRDLDLGRRPPNPFSSWRDLINW
jgi:hypothetical protein